MKLNIKIIESDRPHAFKQTFSYFWYLPLVTWKNLQSLFVVFCTIFINGLLPSIQAILVIFLSMILSVLLPIACFFLSLFGYIIKPKSASESA